MSKHKPVAAPKPEKRHLLVRYGGLGDTIFLTAVAHALRKHGFVPDLAVPEAHLPILQNNPNIGRTYGLVRQGPWGMSANGPVNLFRDTDGVTKAVESLLDKYATGMRHKPLRVTDYFRIIENNGCHPSSITGNSDYTNTYDMHLSWAGIDPAVIPSHEKRPFYYPTEAELDWAGTQYRGVQRPVVLWQPYASAPARSFYRAMETAVEVEKKAGGYHLMWDQQRQQWMHHTGPVYCGKLNPLRATAALIAMADLLVSADTFVSHLAEAVNTWHVTWYSTVSEWTRNRYYEHEIGYDLHPPDTDPAVPCKCHVITDARCPLVEADAIKAISDHDKMLINGLPPQTKQQLNLPHEQLPVPDGTKLRKDLMPTMMQAYVTNLANTYHITRHAEPYCMRDFDLTGAVMDALDQIRSEKR
jgi:ADP-heptose:LPS heptosyltransferase